MSTYLLPYMNTRSFIKTQFNDTAPFSPCIVSTRALKPMLVLSCNHGGVWEVTDSNLKVTICPCPLCVGEHLDRASGI